jgi:hypothetical protein
MGHLEIGGMNECNRNRFLFGATPADVPQLWIIAYLPIPGCTAKFDKLLEMFQNAAAFPGPGGSFGSW